VWSVKGRTNFFSVLSVFACVALVFVLKCLQPRSLPAFEISSCLPQIQHCTSKMNVTVPQDLTKSADILFSTCAEAHVEF